MRVTSNFIDAVGQAIEQRDWFAKNITVSGRAFGDRALADLRDIADGFGLDMPGDAKAVLAGLAAASAWSESQSAPLEIAVGALLVFCADALATEAQDDQR